MTKNVSVPEGYKKTELGVIPKEWEVVKLYEISNTYSGGTPPKSKIEYFGGNIPWVKSGELNKGLIFKTEEFISEQGLNNSSAKWVPQNSLLIAMYGATAGKIGLLKIRATINQAILAVIPKEGTDYLFLYYSLNQIMPNIVKTQTQGSGQPNLNAAIIKSNNISLPPLPEQQKIASILSKVDEQIEQTEQIIEKTELLKKGLMQKLLTKGIGHTKFKKTELGEIPEEWKVIGISKCCSDIFLGLTSKVDYVENGGVPLIRAGDINRGYLSFDEARLISKEQHQQLTKYRCTRRGDILISKSGSLGVCALVDTDRIFSIYESIIDLQPIHEEVTPDFLLWLMRDSNTQKRLLGNKVGSTVGHLNLIQFRSLEIVLPPLEEQQKIASILSKVDSHIQDNHSYLHKLQELKKGLMQDLLTGTIRV